jgi:hypothetical protein
MPYKDPEKQKAYAADWRAVHHAEGARKRSGPKPEPPVDRFWRLVRKSHKPNGCWIWTGYIMSTGYGALCLQGRRGIGAHRFSWTLHNGSIPDGLCVLHRCDIRPCVRPDHLFLGSKGDNYHDSAQKGRNSVGLRHGRYTSPERTSRGSSHYLAKLTESQVAEMRARHGLEAASCAALAREYGIHRSTAWGIITRKRWQHVL